MAGALGGRRFAVTGRQADAIGNYAVEGVSEAILNRVSVVSAGRDLGGMRLPR
jgi:hypothetical protein